MEFIDDELYKIFTKYLSYYLSILCEDVSINYLHHKASSEHTDWLQSLICHGLRTISPPPLDTLYGPTRPNLFADKKIINLPFFSRVDKYIEALARKVIKTHESDDDDDNFWSSIWTDTTSELSNEDHQTFEVEVFAFMQNLPESFWLKYLETFILVKFPDCSMFQFHFLQYFFISETKVIYDMVENPSLIVILYMTYCENEENITSVNESYTNLSMLPTNQNDLQLIFSQLKEVYAIDREFLASKTLDICFCSMNSCSSYEDWTAWADAISGVITKSTREGSSYHRQLLILLFMKTLTYHALENQWPFEKIVNLRQVLVDSHQNIKFSQLFELVGSTLAENMNAELVSLLIYDSKYFIDIGDVYWILDLIDNSETNKCHAVKWTPLIDILMLSYKVEKPSGLSGICPKDTNEYLQHLANMNINERLVARPVGSRYIPDFIRGSAPSPYPYLADVLFLAILHGMDLLHHNISIPQIKNFQNKCRTIEAATNLRHIWDTAFEFWILVKWLIFVSKGTPDFDEESKRIVSDVLANFDSRNLWIQMSRYILEILCTNDETLRQSAVDMLQYYIQMNNIKDGILLPWLEMVPRQYHRLLFLRWKVKVINLSSLHV